MFVCFAIMMYVDIIVWFGNKHGFIIMREILYNAFSFWFVYMYFMLVQIGLRKAQNTVSFFLSFFLSLFLGGNIAFNGKNVNRL